MWTGGTVPAYTLFENLNMVKNSSVAPWFTSSGGTFLPLQPDEYDRLLPYLTVNSEPSGGVAWRAVSGLQATLNPPTPVARATYEWAAWLSDASHVPVGSVVRLLDGTNQAYRLVTAVNRDVTLMAPIIGLTPGPVTVDNSTGILSEFRQVKSTTQQPPAEAYTPGYLYIDDGLNSEWVSYSGVDPTSPLGTIYISERGLFGTTPQPHALGTAMLGNVISWRYWDPVGPKDYAPSVASTVTFTDLSTSVAIENRHAMNINTVANPLVLEAILYGIRDNAGNTITAAEATAVANAFLSHTSNEASPGPYYFFNGNEQWFDPARTGSNDVHDIVAFINGLEPGTINAGDAQMLQDNFLTGNWPAVSTVPLRFTSGSLIGLDSMAIADDRALTPIAQEPRLALVRVNDVVPPLEPLFWALRSQKEFYEWMALSTQTSPSDLSLERIFSTPLNQNLSAALLNADARYKNPAEGIGTVAPGLDMLNPYDMGDLNDRPIYATALLGLHQSPLKLAFDYSMPAYYVAAETQPTVAVTPSTTNTTAEGITNVRLPFHNDYGNLPGRRHIEASWFNATMQPFAFEFWMRPGTDVTSRQLLLDIGSGTAPDDNTYDAPNQARLYLDKGNIVLRLDEPVYREDSGFAGWVEARSSPSFPFVAAPAPQEGAWRHVAIVVAGPFKNEIAIFIDGIYDRNMTWTYHYKDTSGLVQTADDNTVKEGEFSPVAIKLPRQKTATTANPLTPPTFFWPIGTTVIGLADVTHLPPTGWVVIGTAANAYEYSSVDGVGSTITLMAPGLVEAHNQGEPVAPMIPIAHTTSHSTVAGNYAGPAVNDQIMLWRHSEVVAGNFSYKIDPAATGWLTLGSVKVNAATFPDYVWLGIDLNSFPLPGTDPDFLLPAERWKLLVKHAGYLPPNPTVGVLAGSLPTADPTSTANDAFSIGGDRTGAALFTGELDELRLTALPIAVVQRNGWGQGSPSAVLYQWTWYQSLADPMLPNWPRIIPALTAELDMVVPPPPSGLPVVGAPLQQFGGYFLVDGSLYSYTSYNPANGTLAGITPVYDDLTPSGAAGSGFAEPHIAWRPVIPLNFITTSTVVGGYPAAATGDIPVTDVRQFPEKGYVQIDNEVIAYFGKDAANNLLWRPVNTNNVSSYPRGAYGTAIRDHAVGAVVRHLPVRHLDRYRAETTPGTWNFHTTYDPAATGPSGCLQLNGDMCMLSYTVTHAGKFSGVKWWFRKPLEDNQKVAVLVLIDPVDPGVAWNTVPDNVNRLFGKVCDSSTPQQDQLIATGDVPVAATVEVRFYFDLGSTHAYNTTLDLSGGAPGVPTPNAGWSDMVQVDHVEVDMVPTPMAF
jgi:hypothetical protein